MMMKVIRKLRKKSSVRKKGTVSKSPKKKTAGKLTPEEIFSLIEKKAYEFYESRGRVHGNDLGDWYEAEKAVMADLKK